MNRLAVLLFRMGVRAYPRWIREEYGAEMVGVFRRAVAERHGVVGQVRFALRAVVDAVRGGMRERFRGGPGTSSPWRGGVGTMMGDLWRELKLAARTLARTPGFTGAAIVILALGIGANTAVFSAVRTVLLAPPPFPDAHQVVFVDLADSSRAEPGTPRAAAWSYPKYQVLEGAGTSLSSMAGFARRQLALTGAGDPVLMNVEVVTPDYLDVLGIVPAVGRDFVTDDDTPEAGPVILLSHDLWVERFGEDPNVQGTTLTLDGRSVTIVGVAPRGFRGLTGSARAWIPPHTAAALMTPVLVRGSQAHWMRVVGRLPDQVALPRLEAELRQVGLQVDEAFPREDPDAISVGVAERLADARVSDQARQALLLLLVASGLLLVTACANLAGLLSARGSAREQEMAVRRALGAGRWRVAGTFLTESLLLALLGGVAAVGVARAGVAGLAALWPSSFISGSWNVGFIRPEAMTVDLAVMGYTLAVAMGCGLVFGLFPAMGQARKDPAARMGSRGGVGRNAVGGIRRGLVAVEVALAVVLVVGAGLLVRSLGELQSVDRGFRGGDLLTFNVVIPRASARMEDPTAFNEEAVARFAAIPGVEAAAVGCALPLGGHCWIGAVRRAGSRTFPMGERPSVGLNPVGHGFFGTLGVEVLQGRVFGPEDRADSPPVAVLSRSAAERLFPGEDPLGQTVELSTSLTPEDGAGATVIGVVADVLYDGPEQGTMPEAYLSHRQEEGSGAFVLRTRGEPLALVPAVQAALAELEPDFPLYGVQTLDDLEAAATGDTRVLGGLLTVFALLALLLAATGVWAVVAYGVSRRTRELGLRMALGARREEVVRLVVRTDLVSVGGGLLAGVGAAWMASRLLENLLFGVDARDPVAFAGAVVVLLAAGVLAAWIPARRATRLEPVDALRVE